MNTFPYTKYFVRSYTVDVVFTLSYKYTQNCRMHGILLATRVRVLPNLSPPPTKYQSADNMQSKHY